MIAILFGAPSRWRRLLPAALLALAASFAAFHALAQPAAEKVHLTGEFGWESRYKGELEVDLESRGKEVWAIAFHFRFHGDHHTYRGEAKGSLSGPFAGEVKADDGSRTFVFSGKFTGNTFRGNHAELDEGDELYTGTLTLER